MYCSQTHSMLMLMLTIEGMPELPPPIGSSEPGIAPIELFWSLRFDNDGSGKGQWKPVTSPDIRSGKNARA